MLSEAYLLYASAESKESLQILEQLHPYFSDLQKKNIATADAILYHELRASIMNER